MLKKVIVFAVVSWWCACSFTVSADALSLSSQSVVLYESESGRVLFEKDADTKRPMASTTKLMTALVAADVLAADAMVTVPEAAVLVEGSSMGLRGGDTLTVRDLLTGLLLSSGNDAANAVALLTDGSLSAFADRMNQRAAQLGMHHTQFVTPSGLDAQGHGSTARDMALLGAEILRHPMLASLCATRQTQVAISGRTVTYTNHNRLLTLYPSAVGLKTGFTKKSGRCLVSAATRDGVTLVIASLNGGDYWNDHIALYEYGFSKTTRITPAAPELPAVTVFGGTVGTAIPQPVAPRSFTVLQGEEVTCRAELSPYLWAPVEVGDRIGTLRYERDGICVDERPLTAAVTVAARAPLNFFEKWKRQSATLLTALLE